MHHPDPESLPVAPKVVIPSSCDVPHPDSPDCPLHPPDPAGSIPPIPPSPRPDSLDTQETSVSPSPVAAFLAEGPVTFTPLTGNWATDLMNSIGPETVEDKFLHSGWKVLRKRVGEAMLRTVQPESRIRSFLTCGRGSWIERANSDVNRFRLRTPYCHDRLCMVCGNHRSHRIRDALVQRIGGKPVSFITLTLCGRGEPLKELIDRLYRHFRALRLHPTWADKVRGGAAILEIKHSAKAKRWHPHLHIIADADYIDQGTLSDVWRGITKDSFIVDIRRVKNVEVAGSYVCKYASKPLDTSFTSEPALLDEAMEGLKGHRLCLCFGEWYGTPLQNAEDETFADDMVDADGYTFMLTLEHMIQQANSGDRWSINALCSIPGAEARWRAQLLENSS